MGDHFVLLVDRLITESTLEAAIESRNQSINQVSLENPMEFSQKTFCKDGSSPQKFVECRICQDEDEDCNMEVPCACCGSLKYAHRRCVQRWCNEKGDTMCEICHQQFKPGYTAPPQLFHYGGIPMNFRGNWEISRRDLNNPQFIAMVATDRNFVDTDYDDYSASSARSMMCCRSVAVIFMILLILRHTLPILIGRDDEYDLTSFILLLLRVAGILLPIYIMARALSAFQRRRQQQNIEIPINTPREETQQREPHIIHVR